MDDLEEVISTDELAREFEALCQEERQALYLTRDRLASLGNTRRYLNAIAALSAYHNETRQKAEESERKAKALELCLRELYSYARNWRASALIEIPGIDTGRWDAVLETIEIALDEAAGTGGGS